MKYYKKKFFTIVLLLTCMVFLTNCVTSNVPEKIEEVANKPVEPVSVTKNVPEKIEEVANKTVEPVSLTQEEINLKETLIEIKKNDYVIMCKT